MEEEKRRRVENEQGKKTWKNKIKNTSSSLARKDSHWTQHGMAPFCHFRWPSSESVPRRRTKGRKEEEEEEESEKVKKERKRVSRNRVLRERVYVYV